MKRRNILKSVTALCIMLFSAYAQAEVKDPPVSLLSIGTGCLPYTWASSTNQYLGFNYANTLGGYKKNASWYPIYHNNGTVSFKDLGRSYCLQFYSTDDRIVQNPCDSDNADQQFDLKATKTGALLDYIQIEWSMPVRHPRPLGWLYLQWRMQVQSS